MKSEMKITAIAPWFGSKRNLAPEIVKELGPHRVYWDLCCGSMAVLLSLEPCVMETVVDLHGDLTNLAKVIQDRKLKSNLYKRLRGTLMSEQLHREAAERYRSQGYFVPSGEPDPERAYDYFLCSWLGRNGVSGTQSYNQDFCVRYTANGGHAAKRWRSAIGSIHAWSERLRNVTILNRDIFDILPRIDDIAGTSIYCDPPYLVKGAKYIHDFTLKDHQRLAMELSRFRNARVVLSYYDHPKLKELYPSWIWTHRKIEVTKSLVNQGMRCRHSDKVADKAIEVLLINGQSYKNETARLF
jgi:DNA adenine methylase